MPLASREKTVLVAGFLAIIILMALVVFVSFRQMNLMNQEYQASARDFEKIRAVYLMRSVVRKRSFSLVRVSMMTDYFDRDEERIRFGQYAAEYVNAYEVYVSGVSLLEEQAILDELVAQIRHQRPKTDRLMNLMVEDPNDAEALETLPTVLRAQDEILKTLDWMIAHQEYLGSSRHERSETLRRQVRNIFIFGAGFVLILSLMVAIYVTRQETLRTNILLRENKQRKWAEQKVRDLNRTLETRVESRTRDLEEEAIERRRAEGRLRASEARSSIILDSAAAGIISISETGVIESFNPAAEDLFGVKADKMIGRNVSELMPEPDRGRHDGYLRQYRETGEGKIIGIGREVVGQKMNGDTFPAYLSIGEFEIDGEHKFVGMIENISEQKFAEEQILRAKEEAEIANQTKSDFLANMSHELRTPLNAVIGYSEAMKMEMFGPLGHDKYKEYMINIIHSGRHLLDLVNDILDISAIESGRMELNEEVFDLTGLVRETIEHIRGWASREGLSLKLLNDGSGLWIKADRRRVRQIILNLLSNAIKFTPADGTISVTVECLEGGPVRVSVQDTGPGLAQDDIPRAFSPFQQINRGTVGRHEGSGLGLPLSQSFAQLHGGDLWMESVLGEGATVHLTLPRERLEAAADKATSV